MQAVGFRAQGLRGLGAQGFRVGFSEVRVEGAGLKCSALKVRAWRKLGGRLGDRDVDLRFR